MPTARTTTSAIPAPAAMPAARTKPVTTAFPASLAVYTSRQSLAIPALSGHPTTPVSAHRPNRRPPRCVTPYSPCGQQGVAPTRPRSRFLNPHQRHPRRRWHAPTPRVPRDLQPICPCCTVTLQPQRRAASSPLGEPELSQHRRCAWSVDGDSSQPSTASSRRSREIQLCGNTGVITRVFNGLEVITRCGTFCGCESPGSSQAVDACGA